MEKVRITSPKVRRTARTLLCLSLVAPCPVQAGDAVPEAAPAPFTDSASFTFVVKGTTVGTLQSALDAQGNYTRAFTVAAGGQQIVMRMSLRAGRDGLWEEIRTENPAFGNIHARRVDRTARIERGGSPLIVDLPDDYTLYDDFGNSWESVMLKKYDRSKGGRQEFVRFRVPESPLPGSLHTVSVEYAGTQERRIQGAPHTCLLFHWELAGQRAMYWVDSSLRILMIDSPAEGAYSVRAGFEALAEPAEIGNVHAPRTDAITVDSLLVPMRDGVLLATDVYRPAGSREPFPLILLRTPYDRRSADMEQTARHLAGAGYAVAVQDVRGRFGSQGCWTPWVNEGNDGFDAVEYLAARPWCTGKVGMLGGSYLASTQVLAAAKRPPHLVTIIPHNLPADPFAGFPYEQGAFFMTPSLWWASAIEAGVTGLAHPRFAEIERIKTHPLLTSLPVWALDSLVFGTPLPSWREWISHPTSDDAWRPAMIRDQLHQITIPVLLISGWFDTQSVGTMGALTAFAQDPRRQHVRALIGPWNHLHQVPSTPATRRVGAEASVDLMDLSLQWFDRWLRGRGSPSTQDTLIRFYVLNASRWVSAVSYPLPQTRFTPLYLSSTEGANSLLGDGRLGWDVPTGGAAWDQYRYDPGDPTPAPAYRFSRGRKGFDEITSRRKDILVYESKPLDRPMTIAGPLEARLFASSSAVDTDWFVTLYAVNASGEHVPMVRGVVRARYRTGVENTQLLTPGEVDEYCIDLWHFGIRLDTGWKMRVEVASAYFPTFSRNLNTGGHNERDTVFVTAEQRIYHSPEYPSRVILPVIDLDDGSISPDH